MKPRLRRGIAVLLVPVALIACGDDDDDSSVTTATEATDGSAGESSGSAAESAAAAEDRTAQFLEVPSTITVDEPLPAAPESGVSVYWVTPNLQSQQPNTDALEEAADALGWNLTTLQTDSADPQAVPSAMQQAVDGGADYIIVSGGSTDVYGEALQVARDAGVPVIDMYSSDEVGGEQNGIYANIGGTGWIDVQYRATADFVIADSGGDANVLYVDIPDFPILAAAARATNDQFASQCPDCVVNSLDLSVTDLTGGNVVSQVVSTLQRDQDIEYVFTSFGDLATGLPEAIAAGGMSDRVRIVTAAPNADQTQGVIDGTVQAVVPNPKAQGSWTAIDAIARLEQGLEVDQEQHTVMPVVIWTQDNVPSPAGDFAGAENFEDQFLELWQVSGT